MLGLFGLKFPGRSSMASKTYIVKLKPPALGVVDTLSFAKTGGGPGNAAP